MTNKPINAYDTATGEIRVCYVDSSLTEEEQRKEVSNQLNSLNLITPKEEN